MTEASGSTVPDQGLFARLIGVITSPGETMKAVVAKPRVIGVMFVVCVVIALGTAGPQMTERGRQAVIEMQIQQREKMTGQPMTEDQIRQLERFSPYLPIVTGVGTFLSVPFFTMVMTAIFWAIFNTVLGGTASFKQVLGVITHSGVIGALGVALGAPIQYMKGAFTNTGPFNLGALLPMLDPASTVATVLGAISIFQIWSCIVTAIGLGVLYKRKSFSIAVALVLLYVVIASGFAIAFSGLGR
jgi:hypothetical protein